MAWYLEQIKFFTIGDFLVNTDHKLLVKILRRSKLDQIENPHLIKD